MNSTHVSTKFSFTNTERIYCHFFVFCFCSILGVSGTLYSSG
jgi:hypothetical protein